MPLEDIVDSLLKDSGFKEKKHDSKVKEIEGKKSFRQTKINRPPILEKINMNIITENTNKKTKQYSKKPNPVIENLPKSSIVGRYVDDALNTKQETTLVPNLFFISVYTSSPIIARECYEQLRPLVKNNNKVYSYTCVKSVIDVGVVGRTKLEALDILDDYLNKTGISKSTYTTKIYN